MPGTRKFLEEGVRDNPFLLPSMEALFCDEHFTCIPSYPPNNNCGCYYLPFSCYPHFAESRLKAQIQVTQLQLQAETGVRAWENFAFQNLLSLTKSVWEWMMGPSPYLPFYHVPFHFMSWPLVPSLVYSTALIDFLNMESSVIFFMCTSVFGMCIPSVKPSPLLRERKYLSSPKVSSSPFEIDSSWPLPSTPVLQATISLFSVTID